MIDYDGGNVSTSKFQKRHHEALAKQLRETMPELPADPTSREIFTYVVARDAWLKTVLRLADMLTSDNSAMSIYSFKNACGWYKLQYPEESS